MTAAKFIRTVDVESTGFAPPEHVPIEVGWCDVEARGTDLAGLPRFDVVGESFGTALVHPRRSIPPESSAIHHLTDDDFTDDMPGWRDVIAEVCEPADVVAFAAHNAKMERQWFTPELTGDRPWICTWKCALRAWPDAPSHSNQVLRYWRSPIGLDRRRAMPPHRALPDAYVTAFHLRDLLAEHPIETLIRWTAEPTVLVRVPFGEHRGKRWSEVDDGLLDWVLGKDFDEDVVHTVKLEITRRETARRIEAEKQPALAIQQVRGRPMNAPAYTGTPGLENPRMRSETAAICEEWIREMQAHRDERGRFQILPSEAAKVVAEKRGLTVEAVLLIVGQTKLEGSR